MKKLTVFASLFLGLTLSSQAFSALPTHLRFGTDPSYPPFESKSPDGKLVGFDIDLVNEICKRITTQCEFVTGDFDGLIPSLKAEKIDAIVSALSITEKRLQQIDFSDKLYAANARLVAVKGSPLQPTVASLKGKTIGVEQGTTQESYADKYWRGAGVTIVPYQAQDQVYQDLASGRLDAAFQDEVQASEGFLKSAGGKGYSFAGPAVKDKAIFGVGTGIGLRKGDTEVTQAINKAIAAMHKDGTYDKLAKKYFDFNIYDE
ncbi:transporter substrate-binding domain-containing protein [Rosenbergiella epipactidis]|uniref:lysine/arginine/ornithine ABC transporter substrate-binding protein n=1 Tax=Rosenbergiella epipactidis TaxID=1544694 RepID=UPI001BDB11E7|nr:lysine/arginine/ornithine ABC transporter substrate-binding protein [Rosenbergiella epipactidis]MBT0718039.1 transporter substrate-binding domain-containing protein [Rosenbergiella epipactidis]